MSAISFEDRIQLERLISAYNAKDTTEQIRSLKHSRRIREDIGAFLTLKEKFTRIYKTEPERFRSLAEKRCEFLYIKYTNIFMKLLKDELNLSIMWKFIEVLEMIEEGKIGQHEGSAMIGKLLKELYIDSALQAEEKRKAIEARKEKREQAKPATNKVLTGEHSVKKISWSEFKASQLQSSAN